MLAGSARSLSGCDIDFHTLSVAIGHREQLSVARAGPQSLRQFAQAIGASLQLRVGQAVRYSVQVIAAKELEDVLAFRFFQNPQRDCSWGFRLLRPRSGSGWRPGPARSNRPDAFPGFAAGAAFRDRPWPPLRFESAVAARVSGSLLRCSIKSDRVLVILHAERQ